MMRTPAPALRLFVSTFAVLLPLVVGGCSSSSSSPAPTPTPAGTVTAVSTSYTSNCVSCHGATGTLATYKALKGTALTAAAYSAVVRAGKKAATTVSGVAMDAYPAATMSDADITNDYTFFTQK